jgi:hypothetical protein
MRDWAAYASHDMRVEPDRDLGADRRPKKVAVQQLLKEDAIVVVPSLNEVYFLYMCNMRGREDVWEWKGESRRCYLLRRELEVMGRSKYEILLAVLSDPWRCDWAT